MAVRLTGAEPAIAERRVIIEDLHYEPVGNPANWDVMPDGRMVFVEPVAGTRVVPVFDHRAQGA